MCDTPDKKNEYLQQDSSKRRFLKLAAASAFSLGIAGTTGRTAFAARIKSPPLPENVMTADEALERLMAGNARYVANQSTPLDFSEDRAALGHAAEADRASDRSGGLGASRPGGGSPRRHVETLLHLF